MLRLSLCCLSIITSYSLFAQTSNTSEYSNVLDDSFIVFISPYTSPESLQKTKEELKEFGFDVSIDKIEIDPTGRIESVAVSMENICNGFTQRVPSVINFRSTPFELGVIFLGDQCAHGGFQSDINRFNSTLGFFFPNRQAPKYFKNFVGDHPASKAESFTNNHILWESE